SSDLRGKLPLVVSCSSARRPGASNAVPEVTIKRLREGWVALVLRHRSKSGPPRLVLRMPAEGFAESSTPSTEVGPTPRCRQHVPSYGGWGGLPLGRQARRRFAVASTSSTQMVHTPPRLLSLRSPISNLRSRLFALNACRHTLAPIHPL